MIPLAIHSHFSLMRSTVAMDDLCRRAKDLGYPALGLTDIDNLYGLWSFLRVCREESVTAIIGAEITGGSGRVFCFIKNSCGYRNLCRLLTARHRDPAFNLQRTLPGLSKGLLVLTTSEQLLRCWHKQSLDLAAALLGRPNQQGSRLRNLAGKLGLASVALSDVFFLVPEDYQRHRLLRAIATNTSLSRLSANETACPESFLASLREYEQRFHLWPEVISNTRLIAEKCAFRGPDFGLVLPPYKNVKRSEADALLCQAACEGARRRYGDKLPQQIITRLEHELKIIADMGFSSYFLVVRDIVCPVSRTCGRGSGAASLVAYCLYITNVCPVKHNLYFERFLNPGRKDAPDLDIDFAWDERNSVLKNVLKKFDGHAAMVCNHVLLQPRMAIRETAKVFGLPGGEISRVSKKLPWTRRNSSEGDLLQRLQKMPELRGIDLTGPWPEILRLAQSVSGMPRNLSVHPGGVVITPEPTNDYVPVQTAPKGVPIIQWEKDGAEEAGLVKIDLLGNRSLGVIRDGVRQIRKNGTTFDEARWEPEDDPATQKTVAEGNTMGCFYIESPAMRLLQKKAGQGDFKHLVIHSSIIRPAANEWIREYVRRLHGGRWQPLHPLVQGVLDETFGIMVYQEDVSRVAVRFGFSHADADRLRKIMSKKDKQKKLADFRKQFFDNAAAENVPQETIQEIWQMMMSFDGYSFCKPHSASYARVSFQAAFLKTHFPAEFMAAVISNQGGYYSTFAYVSEARRIGLTILPPNVNKSGLCWQGNKKKLRVGLMAIKHLSQASMQRIVKERSKKAFSSMPDFLHRIQPDDDEARSLIHAGALDQPAEDNRGVLFWHLARRKKMQSMATGGLFAIHPTPPVLPPENRLQRLRNEYLALGFLCNRHPITLFADQRKRHGAILATDLSKYAGKQQKIRFLGWLITGKIVGTKTGEPMKFLTFEDETGQVECTFFPKVYRRCCNLLHGKGPLLLEGRMEEEFGACTLTVERAWISST
ncbi:MAG: DNA polymerase III subunit alpha [Desulfobulbaceae bacterium]|nr:DNA polymerase III subunit alpha [Desulfobulbaceae bacterium]